MVFWLSRCANFDGINVGCNAYFFQKAPLVLDVQTKLLRSKT
jgi:hypothetical protein